MSHQSLLVQDPVVDDVLDAVVLSKFHHRADDVDDTKVAFVSERDVLEFVESRIED